MDNPAETIYRRIAHWPDEAIAELLRAVDVIEAKHSLVYRVTADERAAIREGMVQADRGEFVSDEVVTAYFDRYRS